MGPVSTGAGSRKGQNCTAKNMGEERIGGVSIPSLGSVTCWICLAAQEIMPSEERSYRAITETCTHIC